MKPFVVAAAFSLLAIPALAQTSTTVTTTTIAPAEESQMHEYIVREHRAPIAPPAGFVVNMGAVLPPSVELYSFPPDRHWTYEYATIGDRTVLVDPDTRRIVRILP
ncbi:MAG TPA: DUF1236 domain-containing protein [Stellaceae bacterium]|nr:DUF1236 domain-containing protein [Stellaceae bacterium]